MAYDSHCAAVPADPVCALDYGVFVAEVLPTCIERAREALFAPVCLFPPEYRQLLIAPGVTRLDRRFVTDPSVLSSAEVDQLLATSAALGFAASSAAEALAAMDDDGFEQLSVLAVGTDRVIELWTAHYGDTRAGQAWFRGGLTRVADVQDGFFSRCAVERAIEGQPCAGPADPICGAGHQCTGMVFDEGGSIIAGGVCASTTAVPGQGDVCVGDGDCSVGAVCSPYGAGTAEGQCVPGWMRHSFPATGALRDLLPGGELRLPIAVSGLATVPTVAHLDLVVGQLGVNGLRVALENPSGTQVPVIETTGAPTVDLSLVWQEVAVAGDEAVNGSWTLVIEDTGGAASGAVYALELTLDSRYG